MVLKYKDIIIRATLEKMKESYVLVLFSRDVTDTVIVILVTRKRMHRLNARILCSCSQY